MTTERIVEPAARPGIAPEDVADLRDFFENGTIGLHWAGQDGVILRANRADYEPLGYTEAEYVGHHVSEFHADQKRLVDLLQRLGRGEAVVDFETSLRCKNGALRHVAITSSVMWQDGAYKHTRCFTRDVTEKKSADMTLIENEERLRRAQHAAKLGTWDWDLATNEIVWDGVDAVHGMQPGHFDGTFEAYTRDMHPDDRPRVIDAVQQAAATGGHVDVEYRIIGPDGSVHWVAGRGRAFTEHGRTTRLAGTCQDISERKAAEEALRESEQLHREIAAERERLLAELRLANDAKDEFLGLVSHELKTPITTILGNAQVLNRQYDAIDDESRHIALTDIHQNAERLHRIIDDLLVLARLEAGRSIEREPVLLDRIARRVAAEHARRHPGRDMRVEIDDAAVCVLGEEMYIEQVLRNLISNAEKYSPPDSVIELDVIVQEGQAAVRVRDRGAGFPPEDSERIFTAFYRSPVTAASAGGVGIGLAVCRRLIDAQGGRIWAAAREGGGSEFGFTLPFADM